VIFETVILGFLLVGILKTKQSEDEAVG